MSIILTCSALVSGQHLAQYTGDFTVNSWSGRKITPTHSFARHCRQDSQSHRHRSTPHECSQRWRHTRSDGYRNGSHGNQSHLNRHHSQPTHHTASSQVYTSRYSDCRRTWTHSPHTPSELSITTTNNQLTQSQYLLISYHHLTLTNH